MKKILSISQVIISIILTFLILLQQKGTGLGSGIGGDSGGEFYATKRGAEKIFVWLTIIFASLFCINAFLFSYLTDQSE